MDELRHDDGPRALIVCVSESHGNTRRVADAIGQVLGADVVEPEAVAVDDLGRYDLIGFGSGIYFMSVHHRLVDLVNRLPPGDGTCAFTFSTSGTFLVPWLGTTGVRDRLRALDYRLLGDFNCRGLDTVGPLCLIGGLNRGRPDGRDLERAERFARDLRANAARIGPDREDRTTTHPGHPHPDGPVKIPRERGFHWRSGPDRSLEVVSADLTEFRLQLTRADPTAVRHHAAGHDFSRWIRDVIGDVQLADTTHTIEYRLNRADSPHAVEVARSALLAAIEERHHTPR